MFIWWGPELIQFYNDAYRQTMGPERHPGALGQRGRECWEEIWDIIGPQIADVMAGRGATWHEDSLVPVTRHGVRENVWWTYSFSPIDDEADQNGVGGVLVVCNDVTERHRMLDALRTNEERLQLALNAGVVGIWDWDIVRDLVFSDDRFALMYGVEPEAAAAGAPISRFVANIHPEDIVRVSEEIRQAVETGSSFASEYRLIQRDNTVRWVLARGYCLRNDAGQAVRFPGAAVDITDRKKAEEHRTLLTNELNHRVKNTLATVQAIASQTLRGVGIDEARSSFNARLVALSNAYDLLTEEQWAGADLADIIAGTVSAYAPSGSKLFRIAGPSVRISPKSALSFAMAMNELCTNAAKYGALSKPEGHVRIAWQIDGSKATDSALQLEWSETGGPPVRPPTRKGFGSRLIENLAADLRGAVSMDYDTAGLVCTIRIPLPALQEQQSSFG
jgi:PAS domain S-box-containing protein